MNNIKAGCKPCSCAYAGPQCSSGDDYWGGSFNWRNSGANMDQ